MTMTPTTPRRGRPPNPQLRAGILAAALELFSERGYDATSVSEVVVRAGVTKGALYHYFAAKEDLLYEIYRDLLNEQLAGLDRILSEGHPPARAVRLIVEDLVITTVDNAKAVAVFSREVARLGEARWHELQTDWRRYQDAVRKLIRDAQADGVFTQATSPEVASWAVFGFVNTLSTWYRPDGPKSARDLATELTELILTGLMPMPAHTRGSATP
jgi:AcrR family transcriptional regulator